MKKGHRIYNKWYKEIYWWLIEHNLIKENK
jgi:hypothetical protein